MQTLPIKFTTTRLDPEQAELTVQYTGLEPLSSFHPRLNVTIYPDGDFSDETYTMYRDSNDESIWRVTIPQPRYWSPETPNTYRLQFQFDHQLLRWGFKSLQLRNRQWHLQQSRIQLRGVRYQGDFPSVLPSAPPSIHLAILKSRGVNVLLQSLSDHKREMCMRADGYGLHVLSEVNPEDDASLWYAEEVLSQHVSTLGYVLPQSSMAHPQLWHNAMLHLHRQRRDIFIGISIDTVPLSMVQGHVEFLVTPTAYLDNLAAVKMPLIETVRRFDLLNEDLPERMAGRISRVMPDLQ